MNEIYRHASRIFVWIGPGNGDVAEVIAMTRNMAHYIHSGRDPGSPIASWLLTLPAKNDREKVVREASLVKAMNFSPTKWQSFWHFYQADLFFRVWFIQEVRQQLDVWLLCGECEIEWNFVGLAASLALVEVSRDSGTHWRKDYFHSHTGSWLFSIFPEISGQRILEIRSLRCCIIALTSSLRTSMIK